MIDRRVGSSAHHRVGERWAELPTLRDEVDQTHWTPLHATPETGCDARFAAAFDGSVCVCSGLVSRLGKRNQRGNDAGRNHI